MLCSDPVTQRYYDTSHDKTLVRYRSHLRKNCSVTSRGECEAKWEVQVPKGHHTAPGRLLVRRGPATAAKESPTPQISMAPRSDDSY